MTSPALGVPTLAFSRETALGFQPTQWYLVPGIVDQEGVINNTYGANILSAAPFVVPVQTTFDRIGFRCSTGQASAVGRCAVYRTTRSPAGIVYPGALVPGSDSGSLSLATSSTNVDGPIAITLPPGLYWLAWNLDFPATSPSLLSQNAVQFGFGRASQGANPSSIWTFAQAFSAFPPSPFPDGASGANAHAPAMLRVAPA